MLRPGIEPGTFCVLSRCDNHYTTAALIKFWWFWVFWGRSLEGGPQRAGKCLWKEGSKKAGNFQFFWRRTPLPSPNRWPFGPLSLSLSLKGLRPLSRVAMRFLCFRRNAWRQKAGAETEQASAVARALECSPQSVQ